MVEAMGTKQSLQRLLKSPVEMRLAEVINIMAFLGYSVDRIRF
jgi:hypothetical protein